MVVRERPDQPAGRAPAALLVRLQLGGVRGRRAARAAIQSLARRQRVGQGRARLVMPGRSVRSRPYLGSDVPPFSSQEEAHELDPDEQPTVELPALEQAEPEQHKEAA